MPKVKDNTTICYTGEGANKDAVHSSAEFVNKVKKLCKKDCPKKDDAKGWAEWAGAAYMPEDPNGLHCKHYIQGSELMRVIGELLVEGDITLKMTKKNFVFENKEKKVSVPVDEMGLLKDTVESFKAIKKYNMQRMKERAKDAAKKSKQ